MRSITYHFLRTVLCLACAGMIFFVGTNHDAFAQTVAATTSPTTVSDQIQQKQQQLNAINQALQAAQAGLNATKQQRVTLQSQVKSIDNNVTTLNLSIQADAVTNQQLQLEIQQLSYDLQDISASVDVKEAAIASILKEMQKTDAGGKNLLSFFLKGGTLADDVFEANNLIDLQNQLTKDVDTLHTLHDQYDAKIKTGQVKKQDIVAHQSDLENKKLIVQDQLQEKKTLLATTKNQESAFQKQYTELQKQQQQIASDIEALDALLRKKINVSTIPSFQAGVLLIPIAGDTKSNMTQGYGATAFAKNGYQGQWHNGIDFGTPVGTPILSAADGTVVATGNQDAYCPRGAYGKFIVINHDNGLTTLYGHLSRQIVQKGDTVTRGQIIGYSGMTGYATGPHLHFTVYAQSTFYMGQSRVCGQMPYGGDINPIGYLW